MRLIGYYNYTVIATYLGLASAVLGICFSSEMKPREALLCLMLAGACDMVDGKIASTRKRTKEEKSFGIQIDSLCDLVSFGVLPAMIVLQFPISPLLRFISAMTLILGAVIRLAYYNVTEIERQANEAGSRLYYEGLPVTASALLFPLVFLLRGVLGSYLGIACAVAALLTAISFILPFRLKKPKGIQLICMGTAGLAILILLVVLP